MPPIEELKARAREAVGRMAFGDPEFGRVMRALVPRVVVRPHRLLGGGGVVLRAELTIDLAPLLGVAGGAVGGLVTCPTRRSGRRSGAGSSRYRRRAGPSGRPPPSWA